MLNNNKIKVIFSCNLIKKNYICKTNLDVK